MIHKPDAVVDVPERQILEEVEKGMQRVGGVERKVDETISVEKEAERSPRGAGSSEHGDYKNEIIPALPGSHPSPFESGPEAPPEEVQTDSQAQPQLEQHKEQPNQGEDVLVSAEIDTMAVKNEEDQEEVDIIKPSMPVGGEDGSSPETETLKDGGSESGDRQDTKAQSRSIPVLSPAATRKDLSRRDLPLVCHVVDCNVSLVQQAEYYQRYRICRDHLRSLAILVDGEPQRFCQQCGRFHELNAFDGNKRNCRARLAQHNSRRRKAGSSGVSGSLPPYGQRRRHLNDVDWTGSDDNDDDWAEDEARRTKVLRASSHKPGDADVKMLRRSASDAGLLDQLAAAAGMEGNPVGSLSAKNVVIPKNAHAYGGAPAPIRPRAILLGQDNIPASNNPADRSSKLSTTSAMLSALRQQLLSTTANADGQRYFSEPVPSSGRPSYNWKFGMPYGVRSNAPRQGPHLRESSGAGSLHRPSVAPIPPLVEAPQRHHTYTGATTQHSFQRPSISHQAMSKAIPELEQLLGRQLLRQLLQGAGYSLPPSRQVASSVKATNPTEVANEILRMLSAYAGKEHQGVGVPSIHVTPLEPTSVSGFSQPMPQYSSGMSQSALNTPSTSLEALRHLAATLPRSYSQGRGGSSMLTHQLGQDRSEYHQPGVIQPTVSRPPQVPNPFLQYRERASGHLISSLGPRSHREPMSPRLASGAYPGSPTTATAPIRAFSTTMSENHGRRESAPSFTEKPAVREKQQQGELSTTVQQILNALHADASLKPGGVETLQQELLSALKKLNAPGNQSQLFGQEPEGQTNATTTAA